MNVTSRHYQSSSIVNVMSRSQSCTSSIVNVISRHQSCMSSIVNVISRACHQPCTSSIAHVINRIATFDPGFVKMCHKPAASLQGRMTPQSKGTLHKNPVSRRHESRCSYCTLLLHAEPTLPIGHGRCHLLHVSAHSVCVAIKKKKSSSEAGTEPVEDIFA